MRYPVPGIWRPKPGDKIIHRLLTIPVHMPVLPVRIPKPAQSPWFLLVYGFAGMIAVGTLLLMLPFSSNSGQFTSPVDALFTATSAVCVTGLVVVDTKTHWNLFGQAVILVLIQLGGLGFMTSSTLLLIIIGRRITLRERLLIKGTMGVTAIGGLVRLIRRVGMLTLAIEGVGAALLFLRFFSDRPLGTAAWQAVFHSVSAFNNAGFDIFGGFSSLGDYHSDVLVLLTMAALIILGGVGFTFIVDVLRNRSFNRLTLDSKIVMVTTVGLLAVGTMVIFATEHFNPETLGVMSYPDKLLNSFFMAVVPRTCGFSSIGVGHVFDYTLVFLMALMFIGGASGSTAGGVKVNTFGLLVATMIGSIRGREHPVAFDREISEPQVHRALAIVFLAIGLIFVIVFVLSITETRAFLGLLFETVSAFGTVGLSTGVTPTLSVAGRLLIVVTMFVGRLGPLTLALSLAERQHRVRYRFAEEAVKIG